ncbi:MAG: LolA family protein [Flavobacteriales bacterium]
MKLLSLIFGFLILSATASHWAQDPNLLLKEVRLKLEKVSDYSAQVHIHANIPMIKIDDVNAKVYFKSPNLFKVESKGIAILPKQGMGDLTAFLSNEKGYTCALNGSKMLGNVQTKVISVLPLTENSDLILVKLWIDPIKDVIMKAQVTSKANGTLDIDYFYADQIKYGLPSKLVFTIDVKKFKLPKSVAADLHQTKKKPSNSKEAQDGKITLDFSNYQVNKGLSTQFFKQK